VPDSSIYQRHLPPTPSDPFEAQRWDQTRKRRRLMDGAWYDDLKRRAVEQLGSTRADAWGVLDQSSNAFRTITRELAVLHVTPPAIRHDAGLAAVAGLVEAVKLSGLWAIMPRFQSWAIGCREYFMRADWTASHGLRFRPVPPDMVLATSHADDPQEPITIREMRMRKDPATGEPAWAWDVFDVSDPEHPRYRIVEAADGAEDGQDWSAHYLGDMSGFREGYPYWRGDTPVLPYVLYHAERTGDRLFDHWEMIEVYEGTMNLAMGGSFVYHCFGDASWPQRYVVDAAPVGVAATDGRVELTVDPAVLLQLERTSDEAQPQIGQFSTSADVESLQRTLDSMANRLAMDAGVPSSAIQRLGGTARSGYAISLTNEDKRQAQRKYAGQFGPSDAQLVALAATLSNTFGGTNFPETKYDVVYQEIPLSAQEMDGRRKHVVELRDEGLMSDEQAYSYINPGISEEQARQDLADIRGDGDGADVEDGAGVALPADQPAQDTALNGAQVLAAVEIVARVTRSELTESMGRAMLIEFFNLSDSAATAILADADKVELPQIDTQPPPQ
jgi:hypothetical protein